MPCSQIMSHSRFCHILVLCAQAQAELAAARKEAAEARERVARLEGELDGLKLGTEHMQDQLTQATRQWDEALSLSLERKAAADAERPAREEAEAALVRLRGRGYGPGCGTDHDR